MKAAAAAQVRLLDMQTEDTAMTQLDHRKRSLPEHAEISNGKAARLKLGQELVAARTRLSDLQLEVEKAESDLVPVRQRLERNQQRVDAGSISDPKALSAMVEEIAHLRHRISDLEDAQLEVMEQLETAAAEEAQLAAGLAGAESSLRALIATRDARLAELEAESLQHQRVKAAIAAELPADLLCLYDRIRERTGGVGAAALRGRRCSGCQLEVTSIALAGYAAADADEVLRCEECERILVRAES